MLRLVSTPRRSLLVPTSRTHTIPDLPKFDPPSSQTAIRSARNGRRSLLQLFASARHDDDRSTWRSRVNRYFASFPNGSKSWLSLLAIALASAFFVSQVQDDTAFAKEK